VVTALAVASLVLGSLGFLCGGGVSLFGAAFFGAGVMKGRSAEQATRQDTRLSEEEQKTLGMKTENEGPSAIVLGLPPLVWGLSAVLGGWWGLKRVKLGRTLLLASAGIGLVSGLAVSFLGAPMLGAVPLLYGISAPAILLQKQFAGEFR
jgi:hypothetical protein